MADDGTEHAASLSLEDVDSVSEVLDSVADLMAEVLDVDISADEIELSLQDARGRASVLTQDSEFAAVLRASVIRVRLGSAKSARKNRDLD